MYGNQLHTKGVLVLISTRELPKNCLERSEAIGAQVGSMAWKDTRENQCPKQHMNCTGKRKHAIDRFRLTSEGLGEYHFPRRPQDSKTTAGIYNGVDWVHLKLSPMSKNSPHPQGIVAAGKETVAYRLGASFEETHGNTVAQGQPMYPSEKKKTSSILFGWRLPRARDSDNDEKWRCRQRR